MRVLHVDDGQNFKPIASDGFKTNPRVLSVCNILTFKLKLPNTIRNHIPCNEYILDIKSTARFVTLSLCILLRYYIE